MLSMDGISFQSIIRPVNREHFYKNISKHKIQQSVEYPWTVKESVLSNNANTTGVFDCTVLGLTDGIKVLLMHICPTRKENYYFSKIADYIKENIDLKSSKLHGFLLGSKANLRDCSSELLFNNFEKFLKENNIKYSKLKGGPCTTNVAYSAEKDEWIISNEATENTELKKYYKTPLDFLKCCYADVKIADCDNVEW